MPKDSNSPLPKPARLFPARRLTRLEPGLSATSKRVRISNSPAPAMGLTKGREMSNDPAPAYSANEKFPSTCRPLIPTPSMYVPPPPVSASPVQRFEPTPPLTMLQLWFGWGAYWGKSALSCATIIGSPAWPEVARRMAEAAAVRAKTEVLDFISLRHISIPNKKPADAKPFESERLALIPAPERDQARQPQSDERHAGGFRNNGVARQGGLLERIPSLGANST